MADILISDVTTTFPDGEGVFDVLMRSLDSHLEKQYTSGRIKGSDYATVYLGALQVVLPQAIAFVLQRQKAAKEIDLLDKQILNSDQDIELKKAQSDEQIAASQTKTVIAQTQSDEQIVASQAKTAIAQIQSEKTSIVYEKQAEGFDRDYKYKITKALLDIRTAGLTQGTEGITSEGGDTIVKALLAEINIPFNAYSGGSVPTGTGQFLVDIV